MFKDRAIQLPVFSVVLGQRFSREFHRLAVPLKTVQEVFYVTRIEQVEAKAETDHRSDHGDRLVGTFDLVGGWVFLPFELILPEFGPFPGLVGGVFPEVDPMPQPVEVPSAPAEAFDAVDDPQGGRQSGPVVADDGSVIIVKSSQQGDLAQDEIDVETKGDARPPHACCNWLILL